MGIPNVIRNLFAHERSLAVVANETTPPEWTRGNKEVDNARRRPHRHDDSGDGPLHFIPFPKR